MKIEKKMLSQGNSYHIGTMFSHRISENDLFNAVACWNGSEFHILSPHINENDVWDLIITLLNRTAYILTFNYISFDAYSHTLLISIYFFVAQYAIIIRNSICSFKPWFISKEFFEKNFFLSSPKRVFVSVNKLKTIFFFCFKAIIHCIQRTNYTIYYYFWRIFITTS